MRSNQIAACVGHVHRNEVALVRKVSYLDESNVIKEWAAAIKKQNCH